MALNAKNIKWHIKLICGRPLLLSLRLTSHKLFCPALFVDLPSRSFNQRKLQLHQQEVLLQQLRQQLQQQDGRVPVSVQVQANVLFQSLSCIQKTSTTAAQNKQ